MKRLLKFRLFLFGEILIDISLINLGYVLAFWIRYKGIFPEANFPSYLKLIPAISLLTFVMFAIYGLYSTAYRSWIDIFASIFWVCIFILAGNTALSFMLRQFAFPRTVLVLGFIVQIILISCWRYWLWKVSKRVHGRKRTIIVGTHEEGTMIETKIRQCVSELYQVIGVVQCSEFEKVFNNENPEVVFLCSDLCKNEKVLILKYCLERHCEINLIPDFYETLVAQARVHQVDDFPVLYMNNFRLTSHDRFLKRLLDCSIALTGILLTVPLMIMISLLIKMDSHGPIFFKQERVGKEGKLFFLYKFRTMIHNAEQVSGPVLSCEDDCRVTRVGRFLRHTRLDELPQFINVIKGEMSIIGPRPERPFFVEQFNQTIEGYDMRHQLVGGITGLAQVSGKYSTTAEDKLRFDLLYTKNYSPLTDLQILFHTLKVLLIKDKAS